MANYANLLATIAANIYTNNNNEVTAAMVKTAVDAMVASLGAGYQFMGVATPTATPSNLDSPQFYLATLPGTYTNFGGQVIPEGAVAVLAYDTDWHAVYYKVRENINAVEIPSVRSNDNFLLVQGGGRTSSSANQLWLAGLSGVKRIRIVGRINANVANTGIWGLYTSTPNYTIPSSPDPTYLVKGPDQAAPVGKDLCFDFEVDTEGAPYLFYTLRPTSDNAVKIYAIQDAGIVDAFKKPSFVEGFLSVSGAVNSAPGYGLYVSDYIPLGDVFNSPARIINAVTNSRAGLYALAFYDNSKTVIGQSFVPASDDGTTKTPEHFCEIVIDSTLLASYPRAAYFRYTTRNSPQSFKPATTAVLKSNWMEGYDVAKERSPWFDKSYLLNMFRNVLCAGDSVTRGLLIEGGAYVDGEESLAIPVVHEIGAPNLGWSYPAQLQKLTAWSVTNGGISGIEPYEWLIGEREGTPLNGFPYYDFSQFDLVILEFGWNYSRFGILATGDMDTPGTNAWAYCQIIDGILTQNPDAQIVVNISSGIDTTGAYSAAFYTELVTRYPGIIILNLNNSTGIWLGDPNYHGTVGGAYDQTHFSKAGYNAKAKVVKELLVKSL